MVMKVFSGSLHKNVTFGLTMNTWGSFSHRSYCTAQNIVKYLPETPAMTELECKIHNSKVPTYEQIKNSPELQNELEKMYEEYATDPDFQQITLECMEWAKRTFSRENY